MGYKTIHIVLILFFSFAFSHSFAQKKNQGQKSERIELIFADRLSHDQLKRPGAQCFNGHVHFRQDIMHLKCDSAIFFEPSNSFEAFGHVHMTQGDTLSLDGDYMFYDGMSQIAQVRHHVVMRHRKQVLKTDSLNYDRMLDVGYYFDGGELFDGDNHLTSDYGEYYTSTRQSTFNYNVKLTNPKFTLTSDTLHYNLINKWAHVVGPSNMISDDTRIYTEDAYYNTDTQLSRLVQRNTVFNNQKKLTGDSIFYDKNHGDFYGYGNVIYEDKENKNMLKGDFGQYNEIDGSAMSTGHALAIDYSQGIDTLYLHADTLRLYSFNQDTDSAYRTVHGYPHVRSYRKDVQAVCDSLVYLSSKQLMTLYKDPIVWSDARQILGEEINVFMNDSTIDSVHVDRQALMVEQIDTVHYNQISAHQLRAYFHQGEMYLNEAEGNVCVVNFPMEKDSTLLYQNYTETTLARMRSIQLPDRKVQRLWTPAAQGTLYNAGEAPREHTYLENFAWFSYIRPLHKDDLFEWRAKESSKKLKTIVRRAAPLQNL